jgi:hypothetical protein
MEQQPSDLEVIDIRYQYVGRSGEMTEIERALMEDLYNRVRQYEGLPVTPEVKRKISSEVRHTVNEWVTGDPTVVDVTHSPTEGDPKRIEITISGGSSKLEAMAAEAMRQYHAGLTEPLDPDTL